MGLVLGMRREHSCLSLLGGRGYRSRPREDKFDLSASEWPIGRDIGLVNGLLEGPGGLLGGGRDCNCICIISIIYEHNIQYGYLQ